MKSAKIHKPFAKQAFLSILISSALAITNAHAQSTTKMGNSEAVAVGTMSILAAPAVSVAGSVGSKNPVAGSTLAGMGSAFVVAGIGKGTKDSVEVILDASRGAGKISVNLARASFEKLGISVGTTVRAVAESTGTLLIASGKLLAFIPDKVGEALLYNARVPGTEAQ